MPSEPRPSFYTLRTTDGRQATLYMPPDDDPWQAATQYARLVRQRQPAGGLAHRQRGGDRGPTPPSLMPRRPRNPVPASAQPQPHPLRPHLPYPLAQPPRGAKVNVGWSGRGPNEHPAWAIRPQQETWRSRVLLVWDHSLQRIVGLSAEQALDLLAHLQACDQWPQEGIVVGTPMTRLVLNQPDGPPEAVRPTRPGSVPNAAVAHRATAPLRPAPLRS